MEIIYAKVRERLAWRVWEQGQTGGMETGKGMGKWELWKL